MWWIFFKNRRNWNMTVYEFLRGLTYFKTHRLKMLELCDGMKEGSKIELLFVFKINQEMQVLQTDKNCKWRRFLVPILVFWISYLVSLWYMKLLNYQSSYLSLKLNFWTKIDKLLFRFSVCSITGFYLWSII